MIDVDQYAADQYALQKSLFGGTDTEAHNKAYREELHAREKDQIPNPNVNPGQYAPKGGRNPLLKVVQHATGWTASTMLPDGKEFRVEGHDRQHAISQAIRAGEKMGHVFDPPKAEPEIGGLFHGGKFAEHEHPREQANAGLKHAGQFAPKHQAAPPAEAPFVLQRPKKNRAVATFDNNANTKQGGLFDAGKKNELPGQSLLFNSDAGDLHNPKTMENKVAAKPEAPAFNHDQHVKIAADSIGSLRKQDVYRLLEFAPKEHRRSVADHIGKHRPEFMDEINESLDDLGEPAVKYSRRVYEQFEHETERYLRDYTLYDVDRYGMGGKIMRTILAFMAMHAMSKMMGNKSQGGAQKPPAQASSPSNQDFEKLHPREAVQGGNHKPGQFAKKPAGAVPQHDDPKQIEREQQAVDMKNHNAGVKSLQPIFKKKAADQARSDKAAERDAAKEAAQHAKDNPDWLKKAEEDRARTAAKPKPSFESSHNSTPSQETEADRDYQRKQAEFDASQSTKPTTPIQAPHDRHTAKVAEVWHGKPEQPSQQEINDFHDTPWSSSPTPTVESFTDEVMQHHAGNGQVETAQEPPEPDTKPMRGVPDAPQLEAPRNYPDNLNKPPEQQENYKPPERDIQDVMRNPAAEARKAKAAEAKAQAEAQAEVDKRIDFNVSEMQGDTEVVEKTYGKEQPKEEDYSTPENLAKVKQWRDSRPENEADRPAWRKQKPDTFESATKRWKRGQARVSNQNNKAINEGNPEENIASVATEHELDHEPFSKYANEMQAFEQDQWKKREAVKTGIRKAWGVTSGKVRKMEEGHQDHSNLKHEDELKGEIPEADLHEHLGPDDHYWAQNAWAMLREDTQPKPGAHDREWLDSHAKAYKRLQSLHQPESEDYPEPDYDPASGEKMPFSRRSLAMSADRYFREFRNSQNQNRPQNWTLLDQWV